MSHPYTMSGLRHFLMGLTPPRPHSFALRKAALLAFLFLALAATLALLNNSTESTSIISAQTLPSASIGSCPTTSVTEGGSFTCTISLSSAVPAEDTDGITVHLEIDDTGLADSVDRSVVIATGTDSTTLDVDVADDDILVGLGGSVTVTIVTMTDAEYTVGSPNEAFVTVDDNDGPQDPSATISASPNPVDEGSTITLTVTLSEAVNEFLEGIAVVVAVQDSLKGTSSNSGTTIAAGNDSNTFTHAVDDDSYYNPDRTITFTITTDSSSEYQLGRPFEVVVDVTEDDPVANRPPFIAPLVNPSGATIYLYPHGTPGTLALTSTPPIDPDGDMVSVSFKVPDPKGETLYQLNLSEIFLVESLNDSTSTYSFSASPTVSPSDFEASFGVHEFKVHSIYAGIYASDGTAIHARGFRLKLYYDPSAFFENPAQYIDKERYTFSGTLKTYEGPAAGDDIEIAWSSIMAGARTWSVGGPGSAISCIYQDETIRTIHDSWPPARAADSALFNAPAATTSKFGSFKPDFKAVPDYENPHDADTSNIYLVRYVNTHNLYTLIAGEVNPGCSGSGIDIAIEVKDVGTPAPIIPSGSFDEDTSTTMNIAWNAPTGFIENGASCHLPPSQL